MRNGIIQTVKSLTIVAIVLAMGALTSCSDDSEGIKGSSFSVGGKTVKIDQALLAIGNVVDKGVAAKYSYSLLLLSESESIEDAGSTTSMSGGRLVFSFYSNDPYMESGTFILNGNNTAVAGELWNADGRVSPTLMPIVVYENFQIFEGKLVVTKVGSRYAATFTGKAFFEGSSEPVDIAATYLGEVSEIVID